MKTLRHNFKFCALLLSFSFLIFSGCSDDDNEPSEQSLSEDEITEIVKSSLVDEGGIVLDINFMSNTLANTAGRPDGENKNSTDDLSLANCNQTISQSSTNSNTIDNRTWTVISNWSWTLLCDEESNSISWDLDGNGSLEFDGPNLSKDITRTHDFNITGIEPSSSEWIYNANHNRSGLIQSNVGNQNSMITNLNYGSTDIIVSKATQQIVSGTFEVDFTATLPNGNIIIRGATVVFNGNQTATVTFNNGNTFDISW